MVLAQIPPTYRSGNNMQKSASHALIAPQMLSQERSPHTLALAMSSDKGKSALLASSDSDRDENPTD
jgi:hypothetical protein